VNSKEINSAGFPGGAIYINRGLLELAANDDEVAAIVAHEVSHVASRHGTAQLSRQLLVQAPIAIAAGVPASQVWRDEIAKLGIALGMDAPFLRYSREQEVEACVMAVRLLAEGRFDPNAFRTLLEKIGEAQTGDNPRARSTQPKIIYTNTGVEYWGGGRTAALTHIAPDATRDIDLAGNVRSFFLAGTQHTPSAFPPPDSGGQQKANPINWRFALRSLLVALDDWTERNVPPPASMVPRLDRGTLVPASRVRFPAIPGVASPEALSAGKRAANPLLAAGSGENAPLPLLVPQVDADGNEVAGLRLPDLAVPLATYTGWNFRKPADGGSDQLVPLLGSYIPFAATRADREARHDPRRGAEERYASRASYVARVKDAADDLVRQRLLLASDVNLVVTRAQQAWDLVVGQLQETSTAAGVAR